MKKETKETIYIILIVLLCAIGDKIFGQAFIGPGISNKGPSMQLGYLSNKTEISTSYSIPFVKNTIARILDLRIGQKINITSWERDNYSLMPYFGYGFLKWNDFTDYNNDQTGETPIKNEKDFKPILGIQFVLL